jgi:hypothetical protein
VQPLTAIKCLISTDFILFMPFALIVQDSFPYSKAGSATTLSNFSCVSLFGISLEGAA